MILFGGIFMNKMLVVTLAEPIGKKYRDELYNFFGDDIIVDYMVCSSDNIKAVYEYDLILISSYDIVNEIKEYINPKSKIIKIIKNINPKGLQKLEKIPYGEAALVVNVGPKSASESIHLIYAHGRTDLDLYPYYPGIKEYVDTDIVITQGEPDIFQGKGKNIIDIYSTVIDAQVYWDIILYFNLPKDKYAKKLAEMSVVNKNSNEGFSYIISEKVIQDNVINALFENLNEGIIIFDSNEIIVNSSSIVQKFIGTANANIIGKKVYDLLPIDQIKLGKNEEMLISINNNVLICNIVRNIILGSKDIGLIILKRYDDMQIKMYKHAKQLTEKGYRAKYGLDDIAGNSDVINKLKERCVKMAASESTVLIYGESGTGKEIFAHIIHENSFRKDKQFIAINCASIPENLLESELFGYEEGAFTGAKKGGKMGIFELADGGTLFLDEIGEIPLHLQNRLLRVLQEKEVTRIGGTRVIPIDVRIIAATNVDLRERVRKGLFRKDLYYRICVLPLNIPPLRERGNDVLDIFNKFCEDYSYKMTLSDEVKEYFLNYSWEGNVRELRNCFEYLKHLGKKMIYYDDLPETIKSNVSTKHEKNNAVVEVEKNCSHIEIEILSIINSENSKNRKIGRKKISEMLFKKDIFMSEQEVRNKLLELRNKGFVDITKGRSGTKITERGKKYLACFENF